MKKLIVGTGNQKKVREIKEILSGEDYQILSLADFDETPDIIEDADTFEGNAAKKAIETSLFYDCLAVADDSGLEVDCLNGAPGIYSARYAGDYGNDTKNNEKLLKEMQGIPLDKRQARFVCVVAVADKGKLIKTFRGEFEGVISDKISGTNGFGYDPVLLIPELGKTVAEIPLENKNKISHRYKSFSAMGSFLKGYK